jgi:hypothetical protein
MNNQIKLDKKLILNKETLRELTSTELSKVAGGVTQVVGCTDQIPSIRCPSVRPKCPISLPMQCPISIPVNNCN